MIYLEPVLTCKPAAPYLGGKRRLAKILIDRIQSISHKSYVEPFCGMGGVFFRRDRKPPCEVINDLNGDVINLFRILQRHREPLEELLRNSVSSRYEFDRLKTSDVSQLTDLERAYRFIYLQKNAFGGKTTGRAFGVQPGMHCRYDSGKLISSLRSLHERLQGVTVECLPYQDCIKRYDQTETLFYLDPPYWGTEKAYGADLFDKSDYSQIVEQLRAIKGKFILSINDTPEIREIFGEFELQEADVSYSVARGKQKASRELVISNY